eukprot:scaffold29418_cov122-Isochrysis_galbana.AAC.2
MNGFFVALLRGVCIHPLPWPMKAGLGLRWLSEDALKMATNLVQTAAQSRAHSAPDSAHGGRLGRSAGRLLGKGQHPVDCSRRVAPVEDRRGAGGVTVGSGWRSRGKGESDRTGTRF